jgi:hypothetical protein
VKRPASETKSLYNTVKTQVVRWGCCSQREERILAEACRDKSAMGRRSAQGKPGSDGRRWVVEGGLAGLSLEERPEIREADVRTNRACRVKVRRRVQRFLAPKWRWKRLKRTVPTMKARMLVRDLVQA